MNCCLRFNSFFMCEPQVKNGLIFGQSDMFCKKAPDISVKLGEGAGV